MFFRNLLLTLCSFSFSSFIFAGDIVKFEVPLENNFGSDGSAVVELESGSGINPKIIGRSFYGADANGFSELPKAEQVIPLELGLVKLGGNLHSTYNWELDAYYDRFDKGIFYVYAPLELRLRQIQNYDASPMFQVNMLGWQPDLDLSGKLTLQNTANAEHAAKAISFINGVKKIGLRHVLVGNEPFDSFDVHGKSIPSADEYIDKYIEYAMALRSAQEAVSGNSNDIKLWGPEIASGWSNWQTTHPDDCQFDGEKPEKYHCSYGNGEFDEFMPYFLARIADFERDPVKNPKHYKLLDYISWHYYPLFRKSFKDPGSIITNADGSQNISGMLESVNLWDNESYVNKYDYSSPRGISPKLLNRFKNWRSRYYPGAKIAVTEFGIDSMENIQYHPIVRPLYLADLIGRLASGGVDVFINSFLQSGSIPFGWEMIAGEEKTNIYNVFSLFSNNFLGKVLLTQDTYGDKVNTYAVKSTSGIAVFLINKEAKNHVVDLSFKEKGIVSKVSKIALTPWSVTVARVNESRSGPLSIQVYGAREMGIFAEK